MNPRKTPFALFGAGAIGGTHLDRLQRRDCVSLAGVADAVGAPRASDTLVLPVNEGRNES